MSSNSALTLTPTHVLPLFDHIPISSFINKYNYSFIITYIFIRLGPLVRPQSNARGRRRADCTVPAHLPRRPRRDASTLINLIFYYFIINRF